MKERSSFNRGQNDEADATGTCSTSFVGRSARFRHYAFLFLLSRIVVSCSLIIATVAKIVVSESKLNDRGQAYAPWRVVQKEAYYWN